MVLDANTRRNLELTETIRDGRVKGSLLGVLDKTITPMGARLIGQWVSRPLLNVDEIHRPPGGCGSFLSGRPWAGGIPGWPSSR